MYSEKLESLISAALTDGILTEKDKRMLFRNAEAEGIDLEEFEMVLDARVVEMLRQQEQRSYDAQRGKARESSKFGALRKCPVCGEMIDPMVGRCPSCGHMFVEVEAVSSTRELQKLLANARSRTKGSFFNPKDAAIVKEEAAVIRDFPIPNTKEDLLEFLISVLSQLKSGANWVFGPREDAYMGKLEECVIKAEFMFPDDPQFQKICGEYRQYKVKRGRRKWIKILGITLLVVAYFAILIGMATL